MSPAAPRRWRHRRRGHRRSTPAGARPPRCTGLLGQPSVDHVPDAFTDVDRVVTDALVVPPDQRQLDRGLDVAPTAPGEDLLDVVAVDGVEAVVDVVEGGGEAGVALDVGVHAEPEQVGGLLAHLLEEPAHRRWQVGRVDPPRRLAHVDHEVSRALDLGDQANGGDDRPEIGRHRCLKGEDRVTPLLDLDGEGVDHVVVVDELLGCLQVVAEQRLGPLRDRLGDESRESGDVAHDLVELDVEAVTAVVDVHHRTSAERCSGSPVSRYLNLAPTMAAWSAMRSRDRPPIKVEVAIRTAPSPRRRSSSAMSRS